MTKRLFKAVMLIPVLAITFPIEFIFYAIRWVITGREFPGELIFVKFMEW